MVLAGSYSSFLGYTKPAEDGKTILKEKVREKRYFCSSGVRYSESSYPKEIPSLQKENNAERITKVSKQMAALVINRNVLCGYQPTRITTL